MVEGLKTPEGADIVPDQPVFPARSDAPAGQRVTSGAVTIRGVSNGVRLELSISGDGDPAFRIDGGSFGTTGTVTAGQTVEIELRAPTSTSTTHTATLVLGDSGVSADWDVSISVAATTCQALLNAGVTQSGLYTIDPDGSGGVDAFEAWCDQDTDGGGWTRFFLCASTSECSQTPWNAGIDRGASLNMTEWMIKNWAGSSANSSNAGAMLPYHGNIVTLNGTYRGTGFSAFRHPGSWGSNSHQVFANTSTGSATRAIASQTNAVFTSHGHGAMWGPYRWSNQCGGSGGGYGAGDWWGPHNSTYSHIFLINYRYCGNDDLPGPRYYNGSSWNPSTVEFFGR